MPGFRVRLEPDYQSAPALPWLVLIGSMSCYTAQVQTSLEKGAGSPASSVSSINMQRYWSLSDIGI